MRKRRIAAIAGGIVVVLGITGCVAFSAAADGKPWVAEDVVTGAQAVLSHPAEEHAFLEYARMYTPRQNGRPWIVAHRSAVLAAGHDACDWLADQPRHGAELSVLSDRNLASPSGQQAFAAALPMSGRTVVVSGAWAHLCWSARESRRSHDLTFGQRARRSLGIGHDSSD